MVGSMLTLFISFALLCRVKGFCKFEPDLCTRCDHKAVCKTFNEHNVIPQGLPTSLQQMKISYLGNQSVTLGPHMFHRYSELTAISLYGYKINALDKGVFLKQYFLQNISIRKTYITNIPEEMIPFNSNVTTLDLYDNKLRSLPFHLFDDLPLLTRLNLAFNEIVLENCSSLGSDFNKLSKLSYLNLANMTVNNICKTMVGGDFFSPIYNTVKRLNLTSVNIYEGNQTIFKKFVKLESLDISIAKSLVSCPSLATTLFNNMPHTLKILAFRRWRAQEHMDPECQLNATTFTRLKRLKQLTKIDMKYSDLIFGFTLKKSIFKGFNTLRELNVAYCRFPSIEDYAFDGCPNLKKLSLHGNPLGNRPIRLFSNRNISKLAHLKLTSANIFSDYGKNYHASQFLMDAPLKILNLAHNSLTKLPVLAENHKTFTTLEALNFDQNHLTSLYLKTSDDNFGNQCKYLPNLKNVSMAKNEISSISGLSLCSSIQVLDASDNKLFVLWDQFNGEEISNLTNLEELDLSRNKLAKISDYIFSRMGNLTILRFDENYLGEIPDKLFHANLKLEVLSFKGNSLKTFTATKVQHLRNLQQLLLDNNRITLIDPQLISYFDNHNNIFDRFGVNGNPLICSCPQIFFQTWIKKTKIVPNANSLLCHGPTDYLKDKKVYQYHRNDFFCDHQKGVIAAACVLGGIICALLIGLPCYKYRWYLSHIRVVLKAIANRLLEVQVEHSCFYDAYVMYNSASADDQSWVVRDLRVALEDNNAQDKVKLYIQDRDAIPGTGVFTEMIAAMEKSRKIILVLSNSYLKSAQCRGQADLGGRESYGRKCYQPNRILVLVREKLDEEAVRAPFTSLLTEYVIDMSNGNDAERKRTWQQIRKFVMKPKYEYVRRGNCDEIQDSSV